MRKIILIIALFVLSVGVHSCSLDKDVKTSLPKIETPADLGAVRNSMYSIARGVYMGNDIMYFDYMSDQLNETPTSGNRGRYFYNQKLVSSDQDVPVMWSTAYTLISRANLVLRDVENIIVNYPKNADAMNVMKGEALLWRAIAHRHIALRFSVDYEPATAASKFGIPYMHRYGFDLLVDRGTLQDTYDKIVEDMLLAETLLTTQGQRNSIFLTKDCVTAFKAQVYVDMHKYPEAIIEVDKLLGAYPLVVDRVALEDGLLTDVSTETIFQLGLKKDELSSTLWYNDYYSGEYDAALSKDVINAGYIPSQNAIDLFAPEDFRFDMYVKEGLLVVARNKRPAGLLSKFKGNASFKTTEGGMYNCYNAAKIFRIADMILLKAEAEYRNNAHGAALTTINSLRTSRGLAAVTLTGEALFQEIQNERAREMIGEGSRIPDIKRWQLTVARRPQTSYSATGITNSQGDHTLEIRHDANSILLPIPLDDFPTNELIKGQQNPGYTE